MYRLIVLIGLLLLIHTGGCGASYNRWEGSLDAQFAYRESEGIIFVHEVRPDTFSQEAGLKSGDLLIAIDKMELKGATLREFLSALRGPVGTTVVLTIQRGEETFDLPVERRPISKK